MEIFKNYLISWSPLFLVLAIYVIFVIKLKRKQDESKAELKRHNELMEKLLLSNAQLLNKIDEHLEINKSKQGIT